MPPVPCGFRATIAAGGSTPGMNTHGELAIGHGYLHAKPESSARRLTAPMKHGVHLYTVLVQLCLLYLWSFAMLECPAAKDQHGETNVIKHP